MVSRNLEIASPKASKWYPEILKTHIPVIFIHRVDPTKSGPCHANQEYTFSWNPLKCSFQTSQGKFRRNPNGQHVKDHRIIKMSQRLSNPPCHEHYRRPDALSSSPDLRGARFSPTRPPGAQIFPPGGSRGL